MRRWFALVACAVAATALAAPPAGAANASVSVVDYSFQPASVTINVGESVTWTHQGTATHTVTADNSSFDSGNLTTGKTFKQTFSQPGTYGYYCKYHGSTTGGMRGTVVVQGSSPPPPTPAPTAAPAPNPQPAPAAAPTATTPRTTAAPATTAAPTTTTLQSTTIAPPAAAAGTTSSTLAAAGGGVALPAQKASTGSDSDVSPWLIALAVVLLAGAAAGGVLLRRRLA